MRRGFVGWTRALEPKMGEWDVQVFPRPTKGEREFIEMMAQYKTDPRLILGVRPSMLADYSAAFRSNIQTEEDKRCLYERMINGGTT